MLWIYTQVQLLVYESKGFCRENSRSTLDNLILVITGREEFKALLKMRHTNRQCTMLGLHVVHDKVHRAKSDYNYYNY